MIKKILVAYDEGPQSQKALEAAVEIAGNTQAEIYVVAAYKLPTMYEGPLSRYGSYPHYYERPLSPTPTQEERLEIADVRPDPLGSDNPQPVSDLIQYLADTSHQHLEEVLAGIAEKVGGNNIKVSTHLLSGSAGPMIISFADSNDIDLIAIGSHNPGTINTLFMGSVSNYVLQNATCLVLVAKG